MRLAVSAQSALGAHSDAARASGCAVTEPAWLREHSRDAARAEAARAEAERKARRERVRKAAGRPAIMGPFASVRAAARWPLPALLPAHSYRTC
jgi:hypothetical protein